jgi:hypothetical protein
LDFIMLIKLNYNAWKTPAQVWRVVADIIQNSSVNSIANLRTRSVSASYAPDLLSGLVDSASYIYRIKDVTSNTICHIARPNIATSSNVPFEFILSQKVYDTTSNTRYYISLGTTGTSTGIANSQVSNTSGDLTTSQWPISADTTQTTAQGTTIGIGGVGTASSNAFTSMWQATNIGVYCLWVYITDTCFVWAMNRQQYTATGFPVHTSYDWSPNTWNGPHIYSQYTRTDILNTDANGIIPLVYNFHTSYQANYFSVKGAGEGIFSREEELYLTQVPTTDERIVTLPANGSYQNLSLQMLNWYGNPAGATTSATYTGTGGTWRQRFISPFTSIGLGGTKWSDDGGFVGYNSTTATATIGTHGSLLALSSHPTFGSNLINSKIGMTNWNMPSTNQYGARWISSDLLSYYGYALLPIYHRNVNLGCFGGNVTDKCGVYVFNGDYFAGDDIVVDGVSYVILPCIVGRPASNPSSLFYYGMGPESRLGLAVPKL